MAHLLYHWRYDNYCHDLNMGVGRATSITRMRPLVVGPTFPAAAPTDDARALLRRADPLAYVELPAGGADDGEFVLLVARRENDRRLAIVAPVAADGTLLDRAIRKSLPAA